MLKSTDWFEYIQFNADVFQMQIFKKGNSFLSLLLTAFIFGEISGTKFFPSPIINFPLPMRLSKPI